MTYYAVIDTNVIVSSMHKAGSLPDEVVQMALVGPIVPLVNEEILDEYLDVLTRNKFGFPEEKVNETIGGDQKARLVFG